MIPRIAQFRQLRILGTVCAVFIIAAKDCRRLLIVLILLLIVSTRLFAAEIFDAIRAEDAARVKSILRDHSEVDVRDDRGRTPLMVASIKGNIEIVKLLLTRGANRNLTDRDNRTAKDYARELNSPQISAILDAAMEAANPDEALFRAVEAGDVAAVASALDQGANVNVKTKNFVTPLIMAARADISVFKLLIERGARANATHLGQDSVFELIRFTKDVDQRGKLLGFTSSGEDLDSALIKAAGEARINNQALARAVEQGDLDLTLAILKKGADPDHFDRSESVLMWAASYGYTEIVRALLQNGASVEAKTVNGDYDENLGKTALFFAAAKGQSEIVELLLANKANSNVSTPGGLTALMSAVRGKGTPQIISALIKAGANVNAKRQDGRTVLSDAIAAGARPEIIQLFADAGAILDARDGNEALVNAAKLGQTAALRHILEAAKPDQNSLNSALLAASIFGGVDVVQALLESGANANATDGSGRSAVGLAAFSGHHGIVSTLIKAGATNTPRGFDSKTGELLPPPDSKLMTRGKWRAMVAPYDVNSQSFGRVLLAHSTFKQKFGEPEKTQRVGDELYWYYRCSDGLLQLVINATADKVLIKEINEY